jgi:drug/metabolite transporter (DMT)-like permease
VSRRAQAVVALLVVTILWGWTFVWMKQSLNAAALALGRSGGPSVVALYIGVRFAIAAIVLALWPRARVGLDRGAWRGGLILGVILTVGFFLQMVALQGVTPQVSAFLTSLYVVFAALLTFVVHRARPHVPFVAGVLLATFGAGFIEGPPQLTFGLAEGLTVVSAFIFSLHILFTDRLTKAHAPLAVTLAMFVCTAVSALGGLAVFLSRGGAPSTAELFALLRLPAFLVPLLLAAFLATVVALTIINVYQRELDPVRAAILYALEPIWTTLIAAALGFGAPGFWLWIGGGALVAGNLIAEYGIALDD